MAKDFITSASALDSFFTCAARYDFSRRWTPLEIGKDLQDGLDAHAILQGVKPEKPSLRAKQFAYGLRLLEAERHYTILSREQEDYVPLVKGIVLHRRMDAIAVVGAGQVAVDYKTTRYVWSPLEGTDVVPKSMTFQAATYSLPNPETRLRPKRVDFLVVDERGGSRIFTYRKRKQDIDNLIEAAQVVKSAKVFPKHQGLSCHYCSFAQMCYDTPGWKAKYVSRQGGVK